MIEWKRKPGRTKSLLGSEKQKSFDTLDNTITVGQVPTKVCQMEEVPLCAKHEVAETKKVKPNADLFDSSSF